MNVLCNEHVFDKCGLLWTWFGMNVVCYVWRLLLMNGSVKNVVCYDGGLLWRWSVMTVVCYDGGLLWRWSVMTVVCYECGR